MSSDPRTYSEPSGWPKSCCMSTTTRAWSGPVVQVDVLIMAPFGASAGWSGQLGARDGRLALGQGQPLPGQGGQGVPQVLAAAGQVGPVRHRPAAADQGDRDDPVIRSGGGAGIVLGAAEDDLFGDRAAG